MESRMRGDSQVRLYVSNAVMLNTRPALDVFPAQRDFDGWDVQHNRTPRIEPARFPIRTTTARTTVRTGQHGLALHGVIPCLARDLGRCDTVVAVTPRRPPGYRYRPSGKRLAFTMGDGYVERRGRRFRPEQVKHTLVHALLNIIGDSTYNPLC